MSLPSQDIETYLCRVHDLALAWGRDVVVESLSKPDATSTKSFYINHAQQFSSNDPVQIIATASELGGMTRQSTTVCIIENIAPKHIGALGSAWDLDPAFFVHHASNPRRERLWMPHIFKGPPDPTDDPYDHIDGNFEYFGLCVQSDAELNSSPNYFPRRCFRKTWDEVETVNSNTRISYYRVHTGLCEFFIFQSYRSLTVLSQICSSWTRRYTCRIDTIACLGGSDPLCDYHTPTIAAVFFYRSFLKYMTNKVLITVFLSL